MPSSRYNRPVRFLKHLVLHGYKTFASRTEFVFDGGVTAVIGPNGSGKSNIADALRWVLGEQSYSSLRGKRTEDMIFSGSEQRPRMGMAHVSLILDNSTGWLPIDFSEVEIARRAYRSGENEYYLNGNRVRLRDITELLGSSGLSERTYSIIGQGLVDQALSQRPEERRRLFEEAAGITVYQSKRDQASQKLTDAGGNLTRARDIINELTPRLRYLKGQARRARSTNNSGATWRRNCWSGTATSGVEGCWPSPRPRSAPLTAPGLPRKPPMNSTRCWSWLRPDGRSVMRCATSSPSGTAPAAACTASRRSRNASSPCVRNSSAYGASRAKILSAI